MALTNKATANLKRATLPDTPDKMYNFPVKWKIISNYFFNNRF